MELYLPLDENSACTVTHTTYTTEDLVAKYIFEVRISL